MNRRPLLTRWIALLAALLAFACPRTGRAASPDDAVMESIGMVVASLAQRLERWRDVRGLSHPSEDQAGALDLLVRDAQLVRAHLRTRGRDLPADSREAQVLQRFLEAWTDARIADGARAAPRDSALDPAVRQLARTFPEKRSFAPPFRLFRP